VKQYPLGRGYAFERCGDERGIDDKRPKLLRDFRQARELLLPEDPVEVRAELIKPIGHRSLLFSSANDSPAGPGMQEG
jgi:hypothetical protein